MRFESADAERYADKHRYDGRWGWLRRIGCAVCWTFSIVTLLYVGSSVDSCEINCSAFYYAHAFSSILFVLAGFILVALGVLLGALLREPTLLKRN